jgi:hypothetical protein
MWHQSPAVSSADRSVGHYLVGRIRSRTGYADWVSRWCGSRNRSTILHAASTDAQDHGDVSGRPVHALSCAGRLARPALHRLITMAGSDWVGAPTLKRRETAVALAGLSGIDWNRLTHAYGGAADVPA